MAIIDPPYRLDPLQNPVDVKWSEPTGGAGAVEGWIGVSIGTVWFISPTGQSGVGFPEGVGDLVTTRGSTLHGVWSGGSGEGSDFPNDGTGPYIAIGGGGIGGSFHVENSLSMNVGGSGSYSFGGLTFVQDNNGRIFTATGEATTPFTDLSEVAGVPRFVTVRWAILMSHQITA
jgi:hypothetical protein